MLQPNKDLEEIFESAVMLANENNHEYIGHSQAVDFLGNYMKEPEEKDGVFIVELDKELLLKTRSKLAFLDDKDEFKLL